MKKILILLLSISGILKSQTLLDPSIVSAINSTCCGASASGTIYVDSVSSNSVGDSLIVYKNGTRYAYKYPSGSAYTLPIATTSVLGGVRDGRGVSIAADGTISAEVQTFAQNGSNFIVTTYDTAGGVTPKTFTWTAPDFWRSSVSIPVVANTMPDGTNDTIEFIQHRQDIFIGGADGLVRAGQGSGNIATNTVFGKDALKSNTTGQQNTVLGRNTLYSSTTASYNVAIGINAMQNATTAITSVAIGRNALFNAGVTTENTAIGDYAMGQGSITSNGSTAIGKNALIALTSGVNTAIGAQSLSSVTTGNRNTSVGYNSLKTNILGNSNTAIGDGALFANISNANTAIGYAAGGAITSGSYNTIIGSGNGSSAGTANGLTTGTENIVIGSGSQPPNPIGGASQNILLGNQSSAKLTGNLNTIIGYQSGTITNGTNNVILGSWSYAPSTGNGWSGTDVFAVNNNTFIGNDHNRNVGAQVQIGDNNTALGFNINQRVVGITNSMALGANSSNSKSNQVQIGNSAIEDVRTFGYYTFQKQWDSSVVANQSLFVDLDGKLKFKDASGVVNALY